ncbi:hypothetical protein C8F04DRAFT_1321415 [Mycena alexandri]|uniref:Uncharacterized protein n=1 Tax=Mycena alexandri TaxID=1745969 RepID=A0AAD6S2A4_9AGAR|nr:hypothetical protein C8F04DRAFT_1321415 [Mycena alexandri]
MSDPPTIRDTPDPAIPVQPNTTISNLIPPNKLGEEESAKTEVPEAVGNVTIHRGSRRRVKPIPPDVLILHGANAKAIPTAHAEEHPIAPPPATAASTPVESEGRWLKDTPPPLRGRKVPNISPVDTSDCAPSVAGKPKKRAGGKDRIRPRATQSATIRAYSSAAPTTECLAMLDAICDRLRVHHELLGAGDDETSFSTIVTRSVVDPVKTLTKQLPPSTSTPSPSTGAPNYAKVVASTARASPRPKPRQPPFTKESEERILSPVVQKTLSRSLTRTWCRWGSRNFVRAEASGRGGGPVHFPSAGQGGSGDSNETVGANGAGSAAGGGALFQWWSTASYKWNAIPFAAAGSEEEVCKEFEERNPDLGKVNGWSAAGFGAEAAYGGVDGAPLGVEGARRCGGDEREGDYGGWRTSGIPGVSPLEARAVLGVLPLQPYASTLQGEDDDVRRVRGRLTRSRLLRNADVRQLRGRHRADNPICPRRKQIAEELRLRAAELCEALDEHSSCRQQAN